MATPAPPFHGFFGQREIVRFLRRIALGSLKCGEAFPHTLCVGGSGLGKTRLAEALAQELDTGFHRIACSRATAVVDIGLAARGWQAHEIVFVDEVHALQAPVQEVLYRVMVEHKAPKVVDASDGKRPTLDGEIDVPVVTMIGATDRPGDLRHAFHGRFVHLSTLRPYEIGEMTAIVKHTATKERIVLTPQAARFLAARCRGIPRCALHYMRKLHLFFPDQVGNSEFTVAHVREFFEQDGVDDHGRTRDDRRYMDQLKNGSTKSLRTMSLVLQLDETYLRKHTEPWLLKQAWVEIASDGRGLTEAGVKIASGAEQAVRP